MDTIMAPVVSHKVPVNVPSGGGTGGDIIDDPNDDTIIIADELRVFDF